jgi:hypothetical protein
MFFIIEKFNNWFDDLKYSFELMCILIILCFASLFLVLIFPKYVLINFLISLFSVIIMTLRICGMLHKKGRKW